MLKIGNWTNSDIFNPKKAYRFSHQIYQQISNNMDKHQQRKIGKTTNRHGIYRVVACILQVRSMAWVSSTLSPLDMSGNKVTRRVRGGLFWPRLGSECTVPKRKDRKIVRMDQKWTKRQNEWPPEFPEIDLGAMEKVCNSPREGGG